MTAVDRVHLTYPDVTRLKSRLVAAKHQHLILFSVTEVEADPFTVEWRSSCTPSQDMTAYHQWVRWDLPSERAHVHCDCTAGYYGTPCKHISLLLDAAGLLDGQTAVRVADDVEYQRYEVLALLPEWKDDDDAK